MTGKPVETTERIHAARVRKAEQDVAWTRQNLARARTILAVAAANLARPDRTSCGSPTLPLPSTWSSATGTPPREGSWAQFTSWAFGDRIRRAGLMPSFGSVGDGLDNAMMESHRSSMQIELRERQRWNTRVELAKASFEYIAIFHNRRRRHSSLSYLSPIEFELRSELPPIPA